MKTIEKYKKEYDEILGKSLYTVSFTNKMRDFIFEDYTKALLDELEKKHIVEMADACLNARKEEKDALLDEVKKMASKKYMEIIEVEPNFYAPKDSAVSLSFARGFNYALDSIIASIDKIK